jgi:hypothetical protein
MAASAAYWIAAQADELVVTPSGFVGSIGTYAIHEDWSKFNEDFGVLPTYISAGKYKTEGNPDEPLSTTRARDGSRPSTTVPGDVRQPTSRAPAASPRPPSVTASARAASCPPPAPSTPGWSTASRPTRTSSTGLVAGDITRPAARPRAPERPPRRSCASSSDHAARTPALRSPRRSTTPPRTRRRRACARPRAARRTRQTTSTTPPAAGGRHGGSTVVAAAPQTPSLTAHQEAQAPPGGSSSACTPCSRSTRRPLELAGPAPPRVGGLSSSRELLRVRRAPQRLRRRTRPR